MRFSVVRKVFYTFLYYKNTTKLDKKQDVFRLVKKSKKKQKNSSKKILDLAASLC